MNEPNEIPPEVEAQQAPPGVEAQPPTPSLLAPGRQPGESFEDYQRRRKAGNQRVDAYLRGRWVKPPGRMRPPKSHRLRSEERPG